MSNYLIAVGGTGAKICESVIYLSAAGVIRASDLHVLIVDQDVANGNLDRTQQLLETYLDCRKIGFDAYSDIFPVKMTKSFPNVWAPIPENNANLNGIIGYSAIPKKDEAIKNLYDVLFTRKEMQMSLDEGFRGHPSIGSAAFYKAVDLKEEEPWKSFVEKANLDIQSGRKINILLAGSIFGGTGASGIPTISRLIKTKLQQKGINDEFVRLGCILLLPYFVFTGHQNGEDGDLVARAENFLVKSKIALQYYYTRAFLEVFESIYLIGDNNPRAVKTYSVGAGEQKNDANLVELLGGLAVADFCESQNHETRSRVKIIARKIEQSVSWEDLPNSKEVRTKLGSFLRFAFVFLAYYKTLLNRSNELSPTRVPWLKDYFGGRLSERDFESIRRIETLCESFLVWFLQMRAFSGHELNLVDSLPLMKSQEEATVLRAVLDRDDIDKLLNTEGFAKLPIRDIWHAVCGDNGTGLSGFLSCMYRAATIKPL